MYLDSAKKVSPDHGKALHLKYEHRKTLVFSLMM
jgi:hypothetical protein